MKSVLIILIQHETRAAGADGGLGGGTLGTEVPDAQIQ